MKKICFVLLLIVGAILSIPCVFASFEGIDELDESVYDELGKLDLDKLNDLTQNLDHEAKAIFQNSSFFDKVNALLNGESVDIGSFVSSAIHIFLNDFFLLLPILGTIVVVALLCNLVSTFKASVGEKSVEKIITFVGYIIILSLVTKCVVNLSENVGGVVTNLKAQMDATFPILLTLIASIGGVNSVGVFEPLLAVISNIVVQVFSLFLLPLVFVIIVFTIVGHISSVKLDKFRDLFFSVFKWTSKGAFWVTTLSLFIGGAMAGSFDSMSIKATRFALKNYVPVLGGTLSDGVNLVALSGMLIKNAVGIGGMILALSSIITPIISVLVFCVGLKIVAAVLDSTSNVVASFLSRLSKACELFITVIAGVGFMYLLSIGILISTANIF